MILLEGGRPAEAPDQECREVANNQKLNAAFKKALRERSAITPRLIRDFHACICADLPEVRAGEYKRTANMVAGAAFAPVEPRAVPLAVEE